MSTTCTHVGRIIDEQFGGSISPIYMGTSYEYIGKDKDRYPDIVQLLIKSIYQKKLLH